MNELSRVWLTSYAFDLGRYLVAAGGAFAVFRVWGKERFRARLVQRDYAPARHLRREIAYSMSTAVVFSLVGTLVYYGARAGIFHLYEDAAEHGTTWLFVSFALLIVLQDAYFYFTHRAMHHRLFYRFHRVHHLSTSPSPWTAYSFSPVEALVHAAFVPIMLAAMPIHGLVLFAFMGFMIVRNVFGHLGIELFPRGFTTHPIFGWTTTTTHHDLHHRRFTSNFGLYFTIWDRALGTTDPRYDEEFDAVRRN